MSESPKLSGIAKAVEIGRIVTALLPVVLSLVRTAEDAMPVGGRGADKLQLVRETLEAAFEAAGDAVVEFKDIWPAVHRLIGALVRLLNAGGVFRSSQK